MCSITLIVWSILFFWPQLGSGLSYILFLYIFFPLYVWLHIMSFSNKYSNFWWLNKFGLVKRVLIPAEYKHILDHSAKHNSRNNILNCWACCTPMSLYTFIRPNKKNSKENEYWKLDKTSTCKCCWPCIKLCNADLDIACTPCCYWRCNLLQMINVIAFAQLQLYGSLWIFAECCLIIITNSFGRYLVVLIDLPILTFFFVPAARALLQSNLVPNANEYLFKTDGYYGVVDELNGDQDKIFHQLFTSYFFVLSLWMGIYFCCASIILIIKHDPESTIKGSYMNQLNLTIASVFTGLLDYITDLLLIFYWIYNKFYVFATIEISFIIFGQIMSVLLIKDVPYHSGLPIKPPHKSIFSRFTNIIVSLIFSLGFSRVYHSLKMEWK